MEPNTTVKKMWEPPPIAWVGVQFLELTMIGSAMKTVLQHAHWGHFYVVMLSCTLVLFLSMVVMVWTMTKGGTTQLKVDGQIVLMMLTFLVAGLLETVGNRIC